MHFQWGLVLRLPYALAPSSEAGAFPIKEYGEHRPAGSCYQILSHSLS